VLANTYKHSHLSTNTDTQHMKKNTKSKRLTRDGWLSGALDVLASQGPGKLNIQNLAEALGVSRGSFYWHFADRADFVHSLLDYWHLEYTAPVPSAVEAEGGTGKEKLKRFLRLVNQQDLARFDIPIRSWALQEPDIAERLMRTDHFRLAYARQLFTEIGFNEADAEMRARACVAMLSMDKRMLDKAGAITNEKELTHLYDFFIR
jgi:AcrR family transcriptional regulator